jgi:hypothetical protein
MVTARSIWRSSECMQGQRVKMAQKYGRCIGRVEFTLDSLHVYCSQAGATKREESLSGVSIVRRLCIGMPSKTTMKVRISQYLYFADEEIA